MRTTNNRGRRSLWFFPILLSLLAAGAAFGVTSLLEKRYKSEASLFFPSQDSSSGGLSSVLSLARGGNLGAAEKGGANVSLLGGALGSPQIASGPQTAIAVMDSNLCRQRVMKKLGLDKKWDLPTAKALKQLEDAVAMGVDKNGLLAMEAADKNPDLARKILAAYIGTLRELAEELTLNISKKNRMFVEERVGATRRQIALLEDRYTTVSKADPDPVMTHSPQDGARGIVELEKDLYRAQALYSAAERKLAYATESARTIVNTGSELPASAPLGKDGREKLSRLEFEFSIAKSEYGPDHPKYRLLQYQLNSARAQVKQEISRAARAIDMGIAPEIVDLNAEKTGYEAQVAGLTRAVEQIKGRLASIPDRAMTRTRLQEELKIQRELISWLEMELGKARIAEQRDATTFQVIDAPSLADEPFAPRRVFTSALAAVAGLLVGIAFLVARASMQPARDEFIVERDVAVV